MRLELHRKPDIYQLVSQPPTAEGSMALGSDMTVAMAIGIIMQRYALTGERALAYLVSVSQCSNLKLGILAQQMVDEANDPAGGAHD